MPNDTTPAPIGADALREALIEAQAGLEFAAARLPAQVGDFVLSHLAALKIVNAALAGAAQAPEAVGMRISDTGRVSVDPVALANSPKFLAQVAAVKRLREAQEALAAVAGPSDEALRCAVSHAHEILRRLTYHRDGDFFINVNRCGAEALHTSTIAAIVHAALVAEPTAQAAPAAPPVNQRTDPRALLQAVEDALDKADALIRADNGHWLSMPERIADLAAKAKQAASAPAAQGDALTPEDADQLEKVINDFNECGETDVPYTALQRYAAMGYLECTHYHAMPAARAAIDAARSAKEGSAREQNT